MSDEPGAVHEGKVLHLPQGESKRRRRGDQERGRESGPLPVVKWELNDYGNAQRMENYFGDELLYCEARKGWLQWDGHHWVRLSNAGIKRYAQATVDKIITEEAGRAQNPLEAQELIAWAHKSRATTKLRAMIAQAEFLLEAQEDEFDCEKDALPCANGVLDLRTGGFRKSSYQDRITIWTPIAYDPEATCPTWERFIWEVVDEDAALAAYLHRLIGYLATDSCAEQTMPFFYGQGSNGKGVLLRTLQKVLGPFAWQANPDFIKARRYIGHPTDIAQLKGKRLVVVPELAQDEYLDEGRFKTLTGGDIVGGRGIAKDFANWTPTHKLVMATNHLPRIKSQDDGTWRRIQVIPFRRQWASPGARGAIPGVPEADLELEATKLPLEYPGILAWMVQGAVRYFAEGLAQPRAVREATLAYRAREDRIGVWMLQRTQPKSDAQSPSRAVYEDYVAWCKQQGDEPLPDKTFVAEVRRKGYLHKHTNSGNVFCGFVLLPR